VTKAKNAPIGEVECPHKGCDRICKVYRFRQRTEGRKSVFSGKHYAECPVHGRIGSDGNPATTEYILEKGRIYGAGESPPAPESSGSNKPDDSPAKNSAPAPKPAPARQEAPAQARATRPDQAPAPKRRWYDPVID
jgi:hypothetical protein